MKKYAKLLCSILVIAALCTSLVFVSSAEEAEPFVKSFETVDYNGKTINNGKTIAKSDVSDNRVTNVSTMNATNSPFVSIAEAKTEDPYIVVYANQDIDGNPSNNNLSVSVDTNKSDPFTVVGDDSKGYYVIDFDVATHGNMLPGFNVSVVMRRKSDNSGYPFSDDIVVGSYVTDTDSWSHVTIVGDIKNNVAKIYINGVFVGEAGKAVRNDTGNANTIANDTQVVALGYRVEITKNNTQTKMTKGDNVALDNFAHRLYIDGGDALAAAMESGDLTAWSGYTAGRSGEKLPVVAIVDGVECRNFQTLANSFNSNDTVNVEFLAQPLAPITICANANINTNGMEQNALFVLDPKCMINDVNGNIITTTAPFVSNYKEEKLSIAGQGYSAQAYSAVRYQLPSNLFSSFYHHSQSNKSLWGTPGYRNASLVTDTITGNAIYRENTIPDSNGKFIGTNEYVNLNFASQNISYSADTTDYIVLDIDYAPGATVTDNIALQIIPRNTNDTSSTGRWATDLQLKNIPAQIKEMVHLTVVYNFTSNTADIFVNGVYNSTLNSGAVNSTGYNEYKNLGVTLLCQEIKLTSNSSFADIYLDNVCIRYFELDASGNELQQAVDNKNLSLWSDNIYNEKYEISRFPAIATVDGVPYYGEEDLEAALYGNKSPSAVVKILHPFDHVITVNCDAMIYTYGQEVSFVDFNGRDLVPGSDGIIHHDVPYIEVKTEEQITVSGGSGVQAIYNAIKSGANGNLFSSFVPSVGNWGVEGYRNASLITNIDTGDVLYRDSAILNSDGTVNEDSTEYSDMKFNSTQLTYESGKNEYIVVDFDFGTDRALNDDIFVQLVPETGADASPLGVTLKELAILDGDTAHVTIVFDFTNNYAYAFVNGLLACSVEGGALDSNDSYLAGGTVSVNSFRLASAQKTSSVCFDNVAIRAFDYEEALDGLAPVCYSGDITKWSESVYNTEYKISKLPTLAIVDGRDYGSIDTLNKILAIDTTYVKQVEIKYCPDAVVKVMSESTIETNGIDLDLDWNTGLYEFDPGIDRYRSTKTGLAYASTKFIYTTVGTAYTFTTINAENCWSNASVAVWAYKISGRTEIKFEEYDVVFYPYGEIMAPLKDGKYIEDGKLVTVTWNELIIYDKGNYDTAIVDEYPVANSAESLKIYLADITSANASYAVTDMMYGANISTDIVFKFYVNKEATITETGEVATINGKEYIVFTYRLAPHEINKVITVSFEVQNYATVYTQKQDICFVDYARQLLETTDVDKSLVVSLLNYANEAHALFDKNGDKISSVTELIGEYSEYLPNEELTEKLDTADLGSIIRSAAMRLNSTPEFVFKIARGFRGIMTVSYNSVGENVEYTININTLACEQFVTLKGLNIYDANADFTITITEHGSDTSIVGQYNLSTYVQSLEDNAFALALYNYSKVALDNHGAATENDIPVN